jgi:excisionase family DNA binding protein
VNISERQVYKLASDGSLPCFRIGGSVRFDPAAFAAWLRQEIAPSSVRDARPQRSVHRAS